MKPVNACLSARKDCESSGKTKKGFITCVQACLSHRMDLSRLSCQTYPEVRDVEKV